MSKSKAKKQEKVLIISDHFFPEPFLGNEIPELLKAKGFQVDVLTQFPSYPEGVIYQGYSNKLLGTGSMPGARVYRVATVTGYQRSVFRKLLNYLWFCIAAIFFVALRGYKYDYFFVYHVGALTEALSLSVAKKIYKRKTIIWSQDIWPDAIYAYGFRKNPLVENILNRLVSFIYKNIDVVLVSSPGFIKKIEKITNGKTLPVFFPQWVPDEFRKEFKSGLEMDDNSVNFIFTGTLGTQQNLERLIQGFSLASETNKSIVLHILGDGSMFDTVKKLCSNSRNIKLYGRVNQNKVLDALKNSDVCVLSLNADPSIELTLPAKFQAYLYSGKPILCIAGGEVADLVKKHNLGEIVDPSSIDSIAQSIQKMAGYESSLALDIQARSRQLLTDFDDKKLKEKLAGFFCQ